LTWLVQARLVNDPFSDPALFIDFRFGRRALLFDLGDLTALSARELSRVSHAFVSHTHMDHFAGFDRLLRLCLHRLAPLHLTGPPGFLDQVEHKLRAYTWNLLDGESLDFRLTAAEFDGTRVARLGEFRAQEAFRLRPLPAPALPPATLLDEAEFRVESAALDHGTPSLAFAFQEKLRINVWREGLDQLGLPVGAWLNDAKRAVRRGAADDSRIQVSDDVSIPLGRLKQHALRTARGHKSPTLWTRRSMRRAAQKSSRSPAAPTSSSSRRHSCRRTRRLPPSGATSPRRRPACWQQKPAPPALCRFTSLPATSGARMTCGGKWRRRGAQVKVADGRRSASRIDAEPHAALRSKC
jgi:ribonuclease Z